MKRLSEYISESLSGSDRKDLDLAWDKVMQSDLFNQYTNQKREDLTNFMLARPQDRLFDILCDELSELGWTDDQQVKAGTTLFDYWKKKAQEEIKKLKKL